MGSFNRVTLLGYIGNTPELKTSSGGKPYVSVSLATHRRSKDNQGAIQREVQWHKIMIWGKNAELCAEFCIKGSPLFIEGHLTNYTRDDNGIRSFHTGIIADQLQFLPGRQNANMVETDDELESSETFTSGGRGGISASFSRENQNSDLI